MHEDNWTAILKDYEPKIGRLYKGDDNKTYSLFGIVNGGDDYYYGMIDHKGKSSLYSCFCRIEAYGFQLLPR